MDSFSMSSGLRLSWWAAVACAVGLLWAPLADAGFAATPKYFLNTFGYPFPQSAWVDTPSEVCASPPLDGVSAPFGYAYCEPNEGNTYGRCHRLTSESQEPCSAGGVIGQVIQGNWCPTGATYAGGECVCNTGYYQDGNTCVAGCPTAETREVTMFMGWDPQRTGFVTHGSPWYNAGHVAVEVCDGGCMVSFYLHGAAVDSCFNYVDAPTKAYCRYNAKTTGSTCSGGEFTPDSLSSSNACPPGQTEGVINGIPTCFGSGGSGTPGGTLPHETTKTVETVSNGDGTSTTTTTVTNPDGSTTTTTTTRDSEGHIVSETVAHAPGVGGGQGSDGSTEFARFCRENPNAPVCKVGSWGGSCASTFVCDGDPVQCAQAQAGWALQCELTKDSDVAALGNAILSGSDPAAGSLPSRDNPTSVELGSITGVASAWGSTCPDDVTVELLGLDVTIPLSELCWLLELLGLINVALTAIACARIVGIWS